MNYSEVVSKGFRGLKSGAAWWFFVSIQLAMIAIYVVVFAAAVALSGGVGTLANAYDTIMNGSVSSLEAMAPLMAAYLGLIAAGLLALPISIIGAGGLVHITDETQAGRRATAGDAWAFGVRNLGRVFVIGLAVFAISFVIVAIAMIPFVIAIAALVRGGGNNLGIVCGGVCGMGLVFLLMVAAVLLLSVYSELALRYALIGHRTAGDALSAGWKALRACFRQALVFLLIVTGILMAIGVAQSAVNWVIELVVLGSAVTFPASASAGQAFGTMVRVMMVTMPVGIAVALLSGILRTSLWTAFFRRMTGLDPETLQYAYPPAGAIGGQEWWSQPPTGPMEPPDA